MPENEYEYLEKAPPGFTKARSIIKESGDSISALGLKGTKFDYYRGAIRYRLATSIRGLSLKGFEAETGGMVPSPQATLSCETLRQTWGSRVC